MSGVIFKTDAGREAIMRWYADKLARFSIPVESHMVESFAGMTHMLVAGDAGAQPAVILHGGFMNGAAMEAEITTLVKTHRVYALDILGQAGKSAEAHLDAHSNEPVRWLGEILDQLGVDQTDIVALSLGGLMALKFARNAPERVRKLVLLDAGGLAPGQKKGMAKMMFALLRCNLRPTEKNFSRAAIPPFYTKNATPDLDLVRLMGMGFKHIKPDRGSRGTPPFTKSDLSQFTAPVMVVYGAQDALFDAKTAVAQAKAVFANFAKGVIVPNQGHLMGKEVQAEVLGQVAAFLNEA